MRSKNFIVPLVIYPFEVMVSFGQSDEMLLKTLSPFLTQSEIESKNFSFRADEDAKALIFRCGQVLIRTQSIPKSIYEYGTLQHEIFHAVSFVMERIGVKFCNKSDEAYAYLIGYLTREIYKQI